jgi:hypothetical protein
MLNIGASLFAFALVVNRINSGFFSIAYMPGAPRSGFRKASPGSVPRALASGRWRRLRSLTFAVLTRRLNPDLGVPNI